MIKHHTRRPIPFLVYVFLTAMGNVVLRKRKVVCGIFFTILTYLLAPPPMKMSPRVLPFAPFFCFEWENHRKSMDVEPGGKVFPKISRNLVRHIIICVEFRSS